MTDRKAEFEKIIKPYESALLDIEKRIYFIEAVEEQWKLKCVDNTFTVRNSVMWMMYSDSYRILVVELSSFLKALVEEGGFLNNMNNFLSQLKVPGKTKINVPKGNISFLGDQPSEEEIKRIEREMDVSFKMRYQAQVLKTICKLFPRLEGMKHSDPNFKVTQEDIKDLKTKMNLSEHDIVDARNSYAHRYDSGVKDEQLKFIPMEEIRKLTNTLEELLNDFRHVIAQSSFAYGDMNYSGSKQVAEDFVELVTIGSINQIHNKFGISDALGGRDKAYEHPVFFYQFRERYWKDNKIPSHSKSE